MRKKILFLILALIIAVSASVTVTAATNENHDEPGPYISVDPSLEAAMVMVSDVSGKIGEEVSVDIVMKNNPGIAAFRFFIDFDEEHLEPISISKGKAVSAGNIYSNVSSKDISVVITTWDNASDVAINGVAFTMVFKIKDTSGISKYPLILTYNQVDVCNENFEDVFFEVVDGSITVNGFDVYADGATQIDAGNTLKMLVSLSENNALRDDLVWTTDNELVATVDQNGILTGVGAGTVTVTATIAGTSCSASCEITVVESAMLTGVVTSYLSDTDDVLIELIKKGEIDPSYSVTVTGNSADYLIEHVAEGTYTMRVYKNNHVTREYEIVVADEDIVQDVKIHLVGDINGDGKIMVTDYNAILRHVKKTKSLEGYEFDCADADGNGRIMVTDYNAVLRHVKKTSSLW